MLVLAATLPDDAFLQTYAQRGDCYTDCYCIDVQGPVSLEQLLTLGVGFSALLGPHKLYSRLLLSAAGKRLT